MASVGFDQIKWPQGLVLQWSGKIGSGTKDYPAFGGRPGSGSLAGWVVLDGSFYGEFRVPDEKSKFIIKKEGKGVFLEMAPIMKL